jgi:hypothetical protein
MALKMTCIAICNGKQRKGKQRALIPVENINEMSRQRSLSRFVGSFKKLSLQVVDDFSEPLSEPCRPIPILPERSIKSCLPDHIKFSGVEKVSPELPHHQTATPPHSSTHDNSPATL